MTKDSVIDIIHKTICDFFDVVEDDSEEPINEKGKLLLEVNKALCNAIREMPNERKTGRWEFVSYGDGLGNYHCSECRTIASSYYVGSLVNRHWEYRLTKYCPGCGAKMEGVK